MNNQKIELDKKIKGYQAAIEAEQKKVAEFSHDKKLAAEARLEEANQRVVDTDAQIAQKQQDRTHAEQEMHNVRRTHDQLKDRVDVARQEIMSTQSQLDLISQRERNKLAPYGKNMEQVLADISRQQWHGQPPVGPLGQYVRVRDPKWAPVMRVRLGQLMSAFAITDGRDRRTLDQILKRHQKYVILSVLR